MPSKCVVTCGIGRLRGLLLRGWLLVVRGRDHLRPLRRGHVLQVWHVELLPRKFSLSRGELRQYVVQVQRRLLGKKPSQTPVLGHSLNPALPNP
jgi:hypothetical protein